MNPEFLKYWGRRPDYARYYSGASGASSFLNRQGVSASFASPVRPKAVGGGPVILTNVPGNAMINISNLSSAQVRDNFEFLLSAADGHSEIAAAVRGGGFISANNLFTRSELSNVDTKTSKSPLCNNLIERYCLRHMQKLASSGGAKKSFFLSPELMGAIEELWARHDQDKNNQLDSDDFKDNVAGARGHSKKVMKNLQTYLDINGDGKIESLDEYVTCIITRALRRMCQHNPDYIQATSQITTLAEYFGILKNTLKSFIHLEVLIVNMIFEQPDQDWITSLLV